MKRGPSPATVIAVVALFFSLTGAGAATAIHDSWGQRPQRTRYRVVYGQPVMVGPGNIASTIALCPEGSTVVGGGYAGSLVPEISAPSREVGRPYWVVSLTNKTTTAGTVRAVAICVR